MVVFTCNHCGDSLQKPRVEKHYTFQCRNYKSLTCVDCFKDFKDEEYVVHTKCVTEEQRYSAKGSIPAGIVKKGEAKQENWMDMIRSIVQTETNLKPSVRNLLNGISNNANVPRKKVKFINFIKSSFGGRATLNDIEAVWDVIEKYRIQASEQNKKAKEENGSKAQVEGTGEVSKKRKKNSGNDVASDSASTEISEISDKKNKKDASEDLVPPKKQKKTDENGTASDSAPLESSDSLKKKKKSKKTKAEVESAPISNDTNGNNDTELPQQAEDETETNGNDVTTEKFSFDSIISKILNEKRSISLKKLQKKVLKAYSKQTGESADDAKVIKKYNKKLKKIPNVTIDDNVATLLDN